MPLIELDHVHFSYPGSGASALGGISLSIERGEYLAIIGANGSGKSTLLRLLNGLLTPSAGRVFIEGRSTADEAGRRTATAAVGLVFQSPFDQIVSSSVEEDVAFGPENLGLPRPEIIARVHAALAAVGLSGFERKATHFLSVGQQQRLAIAGVLATDAVCLAFDEATSMLDPEGREATLRLIDALVVEGKTVLHVTHDMTEACRASRVLVLDEGAIAFDGSPEELISAEARAIAAVSALGYPDGAALAIELGLEPIARESAAAIAERIAAVFDLPFASRGASRGAAQNAIGGAPATSTETPAESAFEIRSARHAYLRGTANETESLRGIDLHVARGASLAFVGRTGSGKSTALQLLDGLVAPSSGTVRSLGLELGSPRLDLRSLRMRAPLAIQRPESALFERYAGDDVAFGPRNLGLSGRTLVDRVRSAMEETGLAYEAFRDRQSRSLSGGEKRRLALAGILAMRGDALLLDEPTSALDPATKASVLELVRGAARRGTTVVYATHSMEEAAMADFIAVFAEGKIAAYGEPAEVFYDLFDPAWALRRPFACEVAVELEARGFSLGARPLELAGLAAAIRAAAKLPA